MALFIASFCLVFLLGLQQQNVTHEYHGWSLVTSYLIAMAQVGFIQITAGGDYLTSVMVSGTGGALGASLSMVVHKQIRRRRPVIGSRVG